MNKLEDFTPYLNDPELLISKAKECGYMYFKQLISREKIESLKMTILLKMKEMGWIDEEYPLNEVRVNGGVHVGESPSDQWVQFYKEIIRLEQITNLAFDSSILKVVNTVLSPPVLPHCRMVFRAYSPTDNPFATPPHRDYTWTGGTKNFWTAWIPLTDIDVSLGGLSLVSGSHKMELQPISNDERKGWEVPKNVEWLTSDNFQLGDVVFFTSWTLHAGNPNLTANKIRLSLDFRYQSSKESIREDSLCAHWNEVFGMEWEEIYQDWTENSLYKYYWKEFKNIATDTESTYRQSIKERYLLHKLMNTFKK